LTIELRKDRRLVLIIIRKANTILNGHKPYICIVDSNNSERCGRSYHKRFAATEETIKEQIKRYEKRGFIATPIKYTIGE